MTFFSALVSGYAHGVLCIKYGLPLSDAAALTQTSGAVGAHYGGRLANWIERRYG